MKKGNELPEAESLPKIKRNRQQAKLKIRQLLRSFIPLDQLKKQTDTENKTNNN